MKFIKKSSALIIIFFLYFIAACSINHVQIKDTVPSKLSSESKTSYEAGKGILLFSAQDGSIDSEAYADWAEYLNEFQASNSSSFFIIEMNKQERIAFGMEQQEFSMFLKKGYPSYFYEGLIVEPQVYEAVSKVYSRQKLSSMDKSFLPETFCTPQSKVKPC